MDGIVIYSYRNDNCSNYINLNDTIKAIDKKGYSENFKINDEVLQKIKGEISSNKINVSTKKNINNIDVSKDETIKIEDVELNLPKEVVEARDYQYNLI